MKDLRVLGAGLVSVDNLFLVRNGTFATDSEFEGASPREDLPCRYLGSHGGGSASNTACILSKLGFETSIIGAVGADSGAKIVRDEFREFDVDTHLLVQREEGTTRQFSHLIFPNDHEFASVCPICRNQFPRSPAISERDVSETERSSQILDAIHESDILHVDRANRLTLRLVDYAYRQGKIVSFDFGYYGYWGNYDTVSEIIKRTTILKTSKAAARTYLRRVGKNDFRELNPNLPICVTTIGDRGIEATYRTQGGTKSFEVKPYKVDPVVDRGGAGDAFHAGMLYGLKENLSHGKPIHFTEPELMRSLNIAQGMAALACTDYGARAYFLQKINENDFESAIMSDFEKIEKGEYEGTPADPNQLFVKSRDKLLSHALCGVCGRPFLKDGETLYERKIDSCPWTMASSYHVGSTTKKTVAKAPGRRIYLVGSGASLSVALFGALMINQFSEMNGIALSPYEYVNLARSQSCAILISFGGKNPDILSALQRARDGVSDEIHVITGNGQSELARQAAGIHGAFVHEVSSKISDAGFVSTQGMLSCLSMLYGVLSRSFGLDTQELSDFFTLENLTRVFSKAKKDVETAFGAISDSLDNLDPLHLVALGSGWAWPAVVDFESKITEGAVCTIEISELKNYTHGRYLNAYRNKDSRLFIIFGLPPDGKLVRFLNEKLCREFPVLTITTQLDPPIGSLDLIVRALYASSAISKRLGLDIAKAWRFPKESRGLFSWGPIYSSGSRLTEFVQKSSKTPSEYQSQLL